VRFDRATRWAGAAFALAGALGALFMGAVGRLDVLERRHRSAHAARGAASALEARLDRSVSAAWALAAVVRQHGELHDFEGLAAEMISIYGGIRCLQLAPAGVVRHIHPLAGNEAALGHDLLVDPARREEARAARAARRLTVSGPLALKQGGVGLVARYPVFVPQADGGEAFWGFTIVLLSLEEVLADSALRELGREGYAFALSAESGAGAPTGIASGGTLAPDPVSAAVRLADREWTLAVAPTAGWRDPAREAIRWLAAALFAAACAGAAYALARRPERLRALVAERTQELARAYAQLEVDAAERSRAEEQLRQAHKMEAIGQLAGGVAHDFNNLLTGILSCAAEVREELPAGSPAAEAAGTIEQAARRAAELTRQLLGFARRGKLCSAPVDVHAAVLEVTRLLGRTLDARISIATRLEAPRATVLGDSGQIHQAILNLAVNARDAMPRGGVLTLATALVERTAADLGPHPGARAGPHVALSVSDTGEGVPGDIVHRIFEPFFTTKEPGRGTGLGLATVYGIAVNHGGFVEVGNEPRGGARFTLFLPLHEGVAAAWPGETAAARCGGRVLLVDDEAFVRAGAERALARLGCEVTVCDGGEAAVRHLEANRVDLAIVDLGMPGLDGLQTFRALRAVDPGLPVVIASGYGRDGRAQEVLDEGALAFLQKPWTLEQLAGAVTVALAARRGA
jgi:two-component system cell cycle sensor histidine kinase/response regulator CckA